MADQRVTATEKRVPMTIPLPDLITPDVSTLYTYLPRMVKSRIPVMTSIRRSVGMVTRRETKTDSPKVPVQSGDVYYSPDNRIVTREELWQTASANRQRPRSPETLPSSACSDSPGTVQDDLANLPLASERKGGVDWNTATTGIMLLIRARLQVAYDPAASPATLRSQHLHGLTYLLRALPNDMTRLEEEQLREALPLQFRNLDGQDWDPAKLSLDTVHPNILSRSISYAILQLAVLISVMVPILSALLSWSLQYERQHRVTEQVLSKSLQTMETLGERGLDLKDMMVRFGRGRVGSALLDGMAWVAESVVQGVTDGAGRSVLVVSQAVGTSGGSMSIAMAGGLSPVPIEERREKK